MAKEDRGQTKDDTQKISIRFFNDREVRAIWDEENSKWWFSAIDIIRAINNEDDYVKAGNYWRWLKKKFLTDNIQLVSLTHDFKFQAPDGKKRAADALDYDGVQILAKNFPNNNAVRFLDWFNYSDNTIDGQSKKKAYTFLQSNLVADEDIGTTKSLQQIHAYIFGGLYDFAGKIRTKTISKGDFTFCVAQYLNEALNAIDKMPETTFDEIVDKYVEMNVAHPFMEGNGRSTRIKALLQNALTDKIDDRETFMKGIDYSYYYEEN